MLYFFLPSSSSFCLWSWANPGDYRGLFKTKEVLICISKKEKWVLMCLFLWFWFQRSIPLKSEACWTFSYKGTVSFLWQCGPLCWPVSTTKDWERHAGYCCYCIISYMVKRYIEILHHVTVFQRWVEELNYLIIPPPKKYRKCTIQLVHFFSR